MGTTTTLNKIFNCNPSKGLWDRLLASLGKTLPDDEPLTIRTIVSNIGLDSALWCCQSLPEFDKQWRLYAVWCARQLRRNHKYGATWGNKLFVEVIAVAESYANGEVSQEDLQKAWSKSGWGQSAASATAEVNAALAAQKAAALAVDHASHLAGMEARLAVPETSYELENAGNWATAYDNARSSTYLLIKEKQKQEFFRVLEALDKEQIRHHVNK